MEAIAQKDQGQTDDVMTDQLLEILPRLLQPQQHDQRLLSPIRRLEQVVELEDGDVALVRIPVVQAVRGEVPHGRLRHDVHADGAHDAEVQRRVGLLHEAGLLAAAADAGGTGPRAEDLLHDEFAREGEDDGVEGEEGDVPFSLSVLRGDGRVGLGEFVGEEDEVVDWVGFGRVQRVQEAEGEEDGEGDGPRVSFREGEDSFVKGALSSARAGTFGLRGCELLGCAAVSLSFGG
jgi:hypothetical protein